MTDKVQKIKDWISKEQDGLMDAQGNFGYPEHEGAFHILSNLDYYIDSLQEEPVSGNIDFEQELYKAFGQVKDFTLGMQIAKWFYDMGKNSQEPVSEDLEEALAREWQGYNDRGAATVDALEDNTQELAFAKGFYRGANWQKKQFFRLKESVKLWSGKDEDNFEDEFAKTLAEKKEILSRDDERFSDLDFYRIALHFSGWKKRQIMKDSVDATITDIRTYKEENEVDFTLMFEKGIIPYELEQEVKVIIVKEGKL